MATTFPAHLVSDVVLRDGSTVRVRPTRSSDVTRVEDYLIGLSPETRRLRFWSQAIDVGELARKIVDVDYADHLTLLVLQGGDEGRMIGGAQYFRMGGGRAEVSLSVTDEFQGRGSVRSCWGNSRRRPPSTTSSRSSPRSCPRTTA